MPATFAVDPVEIGTKVPQSISILDSAKVIQQFWANWNTDPDTQDLTLLDTLPKKEKKNEEAPLEFEVQHTYLNEMFVFMLSSFETGKVNHGELVQLMPKMPNAFLSTIITAYNEHLPLILSPDDFWLLISLGVSQFLSQKETAEQYRNTFVDHEGKIELRVDGNPLGIRPKSGDGNKEGWQMFVEKISELIKKHTRTDTARVNFTLAYFDTIISF
jgi:hypothetical protein